MMTEEMEVKRNAMVDLVFLRIKNEYNKGFVTANIHREGYIEGFNAAMDLMEADIIELKNNTKEIIKIRKARENMMIKVLKYYAMDLLIAPCANKIIFDCLESECGKCGSTYMRTQKFDNNKLGKKAREILIKLEEL